MDDAYSTVRELVNRQSCLHLTKSHKMEKTPTEQAQPIIKTENRVEYGLMRCSVFGLNILAANRIKVTTASDPRMIFLRSLSNEHPCSAHTGNLYDVVDNPQELFGAPTGENTYTQVQIGVYRGGFYDVAEWPVFPACFFPRVNDCFWRAESPAGDADIKEVLGWDALALYIGANDSTLDRMRTLFEQPFPGHERWLQEVAKVYQAVLVTTVDAWYMDIYSQDAATFDLLSPALDEAVKAIEETAWYKQHSGSLVWDSKYEMCLLLPELLREPLT